MPLPIYSNIETPILQELFAVGGKDNVRFLYQRLVPYFPSLSDAEISSIKTGTQKLWKKAVQKAGKSLNENNLIIRERGVWSLTKRGLDAVKDDSKGFISTTKSTELLTHLQIQRMISEIGSILGFCAALEYEYYDVIWRETIKSKRFSHVFEVQHKGNIDSAFAKLKRAYDEHRSKIFLVLASERDTNRALNSLSREFSELENILVILSFVELQKIHENLSPIARFLPNLIRA